MALYSRGRIKFLSGDPSFRGDWEQATRLGSLQASDALQAFDASRGLNFNPDLPRVEPFEVRLEDIDWRQRLVKEMSAVWEPEAHQGRLKKALSAIIFGSGERLTDARKSVIEEAELSLVTLGGEIDSLLQELELTSPIQRVRESLEVIEATRGKSWDSKRPYVCNISFALSALRDRAALVLDCRRRQAPCQVHLDGLKRLLRALESAAQVQKKALQKKALSVVDDVDCEVAATIMEEVAREV